MILETVAFQKVHRVSSILWLTWKGLRFLVQPIGKKSWLKHGSGGSGGKATCREVNANLQVNKDV